MQKKNHDDKKTGSFGIFQQSLNIFRIFDYQLFMLKYPLSLTLGSLYIKFMLLTRKIEK